MLGGRASRKEKENILMKWSLMDSRWKVGLSSTEIKGKAELQARGRAKASPSADGLILLVKWKAGTLLRVVV